MFCAISGEVPQDPVVSRQSGHLFEKRLIEKYLREFGKCPVTGKEIAEDDLLPLQVGKIAKPRQVAATSIPGLLAMFQNEWDEVMLETFRLKQHLDTTRQELSQALYQHDAACRVIARLMKERDEARAALTNLQANGHVIAQPGSAPVSSSERMDVENESAAANASGISAEVVGKLNETCATLSTSRKSRKPVPEGPLSRESVGSINQKVASFAPHSSTKGAISSLALSPGAGQFVLTGGADKEVLFSDRLSGKVYGRMSGHSKKVNSVAFHPSASSALKFSASSDRSVKIWSVPSVEVEGAAKNYDELYSLDGHASDVTSISVHPSGDYASSFSLDSTWCLWDLGTAKRLCSVKAEEGLSVGSFHPDGIIVGTGSNSENGAVRIWDIREQTNVGTLTEHQGEIVSLAFSENGYFMASAGVDCKVRVWDLRKLKCSKVLEFDGPVSAVKFDTSGLYFSVAAGHRGSPEFSVKTMVVKDWSTISELSDVHSKSISALEWGQQDSFLVTASADRYVNVFGAAN